MSAALVRQIGKRILSNHGLNNKIQVKATNFSCSRHANSYFNLVIKEWEPKPFAENIEKEIKAAGDEQQIGILVTFEGKGFVQA